MSKLGLHVISWNQSQAVLDFIRRAQPRVVKMMEFNEMNVAAARASSPGTLFIGRVFVQNQPLDNPETNARDLFNQMLPSIWKMGKLIDIWEGYNEVVLNSNDDAMRYNDFTVAWAEQMHSQGLLCAAYSFSVANPEYRYWPYLVDGARACDYLALHEYDSPRMDSHPGDMCLRYRNVRDCLPTDAQRPILITECGIDDGNRHGWKTYASSDSYISQLAWYDSNLNQDNYVVGATIFTIDGQYWGDFDLLPILTPLANYIVANPSPPPPPPPPATNPAISAVTFSPTSLTAGQVMNVSITVKNNSTATLATQGPDPGFAYEEGDTFRTRGFAEIANAFRVGLDFDGRTGADDHPYRWGLGAPLAPGGSVTVKGSVRLKTAAARNYWAGLVKEQIAWVQDNQGTQKITVAAPPPVGTQPVITSVSFQPATVNSGALLNVSITVTNNSNAQLETMGPDPGFTYNEGDTFRSRGFTEVNGKVRVGVDFDGRTGVDHPYRWGLGAPLDPGKSVTVKGQISLRTVQAKNYWAGLVKEQIAWFQDNQGIQKITVVAPPDTSKIGIAPAGFWPTVFDQGQLLVVSMNVTNGSTTTLPTQGPEPGFIYQEGENFLTRQFPSVPGAFRVGVDFENDTGIDHPYRWGLGSPLAPGESCTVIGYIRLNRRQVTNFWAALIQEQVALLKDQVNQTQITVLLSQ